MLPANNKGSCAALTVGHTSMKPNHIVDNILQATETLSKLYPGGWKNIRAIHVKTENSAALPLHVSKISPNEIGKILNTRYSILDTQYSILDTQYLILNTRFSILDT